MPLPICLGSKRPHKGECTCQLMWHPPCGVVWYARLGGVALFCTPRPLFILPCSYSPILIHALPSFLLLYTHPTTPTAAAIPTSHMCALQLLQLRLCSFFSHCCHCHSCAPHCLYMPSFVHLRSFTLRVVQVIYTCWHPNSMPAKH